MFQKKKRLFLADEIFCESLDLCALVKMKLLLPVMIDTKNWKVS